MAARTVDHAAHTCRQTVRHLIRNYSLSNRPGSGDYRISVKREPDGQPADYIHTQVKTGDLIDVAAPRGTFFLSDGDAPVILLSAGIGVTPVLSMLHALVRTGSARRSGGCTAPVTAPSIPSRREPRPVEPVAPQSIPYLLQPPGSGRQPGCRLHRTRPTLDRIVRELALPRDGDAYLCGPAAFMAELSAGLVAYGMDPARVHSELFGAAAALTPGIAATSIPPHHPQDHPVRVPTFNSLAAASAAPWGPPSTSLLEFAETCDVPTRWSCRTGVCHNCETALLAGAVRYDPEPLEPPAEGNILICCAQPTEAVVLDL